MSDSSWDSPDVVMKKLEEDGKAILLDPNIRSHYCNSIVVPAEHFLELLQNFRTLQSAEAFTGLIFNIAPMLGIHCCAINSEQQSRFWEAISELCMCVNTFPNIYGLVRGIEKLAMRCGYIHDEFLKLLANPEVELSVLRPYLFVTLFDLFPESYFQHQQEFFATLLPQAMSPPHLLCHRARQLKILYALHLSPEKLHGVPGLVDSFWALLFEMAENLGNAFYDFIPFVRKMKMCTRPFFEEQFEIVSNALSKLENPENSVEVCFRMIVYYVGLFPFFDRANMIRFLADVVKIVDCFTEELWKKVSTLTLAFECSIGDQLSHEEFESFFEFLGSLPDSSGKYYVSAQFRSVFAELDSAFFDIFMEKMNLWVADSTFNPAAFGYLMALMVDEFESDDDSTLNRILPHLFQCCSSQEATVIRYGTKAFLNLWREEKISVDAFIHVFLALIPQAPPQSLRYFFKVLDEVLDEGNLSTLAFLNEFVVSMLQGDSLANPILTGLLLDFEIELQKHATKDSDPILGNCFNIARLLLTTDSPQCYPMAARVIAHCVRRRKVPPEEVIESYRRMLQILTIPGIGEDVLSDIALFTAVISDHFKSVAEFLYPIEVINRWIESSNESEVATALKVLHIISPQMKPLVATTMAEKVLSIARKTTRPILVDRTFRFIGSLARTGSAAFDRVITCLKASAFQGSMAIFQDQELWSMPCCCSFFSFINKILQGGRRLAYSECFDLIEWVRFVDDVQMEYLAYPLTTLVSRGLLSDVALRELWETSLTRAQEDWANIHILKPLINILKSFIETGISTNWPILTQLKEFVEKVWNSTSTDWHYQKVLEPLYLMLCSFDGNIILFDTAILRSVCESMQSLSTGWPLSTMAQQLLDIYDKCGSFHGFRDEACSALLFFFTLDHETLIEEEFTRTLTERMIEVLHSNFAQSQDLLSDLTEHFSDDAILAIERLFGDS